jgi:hypothetical protein
VNKAIFTEWKFYYLPPDGGCDIVGNPNWVFEPGIIGAFFNCGARDQARINDGYLAAMRMHNSYAVWNAVRDRMISGSDYCRFFRGQFCDPCGPVGPCDDVVCNPCDPCGTFGGRSRGLFSGFSGNSTQDIWVNYVGRSSTYESVFNKSDWKASMEGVQVGLDLWKNRRTQFGMMFGYEDGRSRNEADRISSDDHYIGLYGARVLRGGADVRMATGFGWQKFDMVRRGTRAFEQRYPQEDFYGSSFKGRTTDFNVELGKRYSSGAWSLRPAMGLDVAQSKLRGATEVSLDGYNPANYDIHEAVIYDVHSSNECPPRTYSRSRR